MNKMQRMRKGMDKKRGKEVRKSKAHYIDVKADKIIYLHLRRVPRVP